MNNSNISGNVRVDASSTRRITTPHAPPVKCCNIKSARLPKVIPAQKTNPTR